MSQDDLETLLPYTPVDLERLLQFAEKHDVDSDGRYDVAVIDGFHELEEASLLRINVWTHRWSSAGMKSESTVMCGFVFDRRRCLLIEVSVFPGFDLETAWDELAQLETAALGTDVYGRWRRK